jgi:hypothetical protein
MVLVAVGRRVLTSITFPWTVDRRVTWIDRWLKTYWRHRAAHPVRPGWIAEPVRSSWPSGALTPQP